MDVGVHGDVIQVNYRRNNRVWGGIRKDETIKDILAAISSEWAYMCWEVLGCEPQFSIFKRGLGNSPAAKKTRRSLESIIAPILQGCYQE